jgi:hypothetical protein
MVVSFDVREGGSLYIYMLVKTKNIHRPRQRVVSAYCPSSALPLGCDAAYFMDAASFVVRHGGGGLH